MLIPLPPYTPPQQSHTPHPPCSMASMMEPKSSWVCKWSHISECSRGGAGEDSACCSVGCHPDCILSASLLVYWLPPCWYAWPASMCAMVCLVPMIARPGRLAAGTCTRRQVCARLLRARHQRGDAAAAAGACGVRGAGQQGCIWLPCSQSGVPRLPCEHRRVCAVGWWMWGGAPESMLQVWFWCPLWGSGAAITGQCAHVRNERVQ